MSEPIERIDGPQVITDEEISRFITGDDVPSFHPILQVWRAVLEPVAEEKAKPVTPQWATRVTGAYREINYADMPRFNELFYSRIEELAAIVDYEIATDADCLKVSTPAEDAEENARHYKNVLLLWQQAVLSWEMGWDATSKDAAIDLASISEVHKMFFGPTGFTSYLDQINFEFTEADQAALADALTEMKAGASE